MLEIYNFVVKSMYRTLKSINVRNNIKVPANESMVS